MWQVPDTSLHSLNSQKLNIHLLSSCTEILTGQATRPRLLSQCVTFASVMGREEKRAEHNKHHVVFTKLIQHFPSLQFIHLCFKTASEGECYLCTLCRWRNWGRCRSKLATVISWHTDKAKTQACCILAQAPKILTTALYCHAQSCLELHENKTFNLQPNEQTVCLG